MEAKTIFEELLQNIKRTPNSPNFSKLQTHLLSLTKISIKESDAEFLIKGILEFIHVVLNISANKGNREQTEMCRKWIYPLQEFIIDNVRDIFVKSATLKIFEILLEEDINGWCAKKELLKMFIVCVNGTSKCVRSETVKYLSNMYLLKIIDSLSTYGDFDFQMTLVEMVFVIYGKKIVLSKVNELIPESEELCKSFVNIRGRTFDEDVREFLNILNRNSKKVFSIVCKDVFLGSAKCGRTLGNIDGLWVDFNRSENAVSWYTTNTKNSDVDDPNWNLILFFVSDVDLVQFIRTPNCSESIVLFKLKEPCMSYMDDDNEWIKNASDVKLAVRNDSTESLDQLLQVLREMFRNKFQNGYKKVSIGQRAVYKPLKVSLCKRRRSDLNVTKSDASSFVGKLNPLLGLSNVSTLQESSTSVYSISSTSTQCEFVCVSDSDDSSTVLVNGSKQVSPAAQESHYETAEMCPLGAQLPKISETEFSSELIFSEHLRASQERIQILSGRCSGSKARFSHGSQAMSTPKASRHKPDDIHVSTNVAGCSSAEDTNRYATAQEIPQDLPGCENVEKGLFEHLLLEDVLESEDKIDLAPKRTTEKCSTSQKQQSQTPVSLEQLGDCYNVDEECGIDSKMLQRKTKEEVFGIPALVMQKSARRVLEKLSLELDPKQMQFKEESLPQQTEIVQKQSSKYENEYEGNKENIEGNIIRESEEVPALRDIEEDKGQSDGLAPKPPELGGSSGNLSDGSAVLVNRKSKVRRLSSSSEESEEEFVHISSAKKKLCLKKRQFVLPAKKQNRKCAETVNKRRTEQKSVQHEKLVSECEKKDPRDGQCLVSPNPSVQRCEVLLPRHVRLQEIDENLSEASEGSTIGIKTKTKTKQLNPDTDSEDETVFKTVKPSEPAVQQCVVLLPRHVGLEELDESSSDDSERSGIGIETEAKAKQLSPEAKPEEEAIFEMVNVSLNRQLSASTVEHQTPDHSERHRNCELDFDKLKENLNSFLDENHSKYSQETQIHACEVQDNVMDEYATKDKTIEGNDIVEAVSDFVSTQDIEPVKELETILEQEEDSQPEVNATVCDQTMNTTLRKTRKLYNSDDLTYLENMKNAEEEVPTTKERENILEKTQQTRTVTKKRQIKHQKTLEKALDKTKKLKGHSEIMLDINRSRNPPNLKSGFQLILDELRRDTNSSFSALSLRRNTETLKDNIDKTESKRKKRDNNNNASKNKFANHEPVRDLTIADISKVSLRLRKEGRNSLNETIFDSVLLSGGEDLVSLVEVPKKINIISDIQIRPKWELREDTSNKAKKMEPIDNTTNDVEVEVPLYSEEVADNNDRRGRRGENGLKTGGLNHSQIISERRIILKHMYRVFKHVLGNDDQSREYKDVLQICKILKKYV